jgi:hypothetical protein
LLFVLCCSSLSLFVAYVLLLRRGLSDGENVFQIKSFKYTYLMAASTLKEKEEWMQVIHSTRERLYRGLSDPQLKLCDLSLSLCNLVSRSLHSPGS